MTNKGLVIAAAIALLCLGSLAHANVFDLGTGYTNLETVAVGDPGNVADYTGYGSVAYSYNIGKYEVTAGQYTEFLNAVGATDNHGLYNTNMDTAVYPYGCNIKRAGTSGSYSYSVASNWANRPVNYVSFWDSCRFANWLSNCQGNGDTETGAYTLNDYNGEDGRTIGRNTGATWAVTSEDEWYKAAYYQGGSTNGYWLYPTQSNTEPANQVLSTGPGNSANYWNGNSSIADPYYRTNVGEFENSPSTYGTFDQGGNVWEWNEAVVGSNWTSRGLRGGGFSFNDRAYTLQSSARSYNYYGYDWFGYDYRNPTIEGPNVGFRVSQVPEPSSIIALLGGLVGLLAIRRRRA